MQTLRTWLKRIFVILYAWLYLVGAFLDRRPKFARAVYGGIIALLLLVLSALWLTGRPAASAQQQTGNSGLSPMARLGLSFAPGPTATPTMTPTPSPTPTPTVPPVVEACDTDLQAEAMRAGHVPEWRSLDVSACYDLSVELAPATQSYSGTGRVTFTNNTGSAVEDLVFRTYPNAPYGYGGDLTVTDVRVAGATMSPTVMLHDGTGLRVPLAQPLPAGASTVVDMTFRGQVPLNYGGAGTYGIFNLDDSTDVLTLANWYPLLATRENEEWRAAPVIRAGDAVVSDAALYQVQVHAPEGWQFITTGTRVTPTNGIDGATFVSGPAREFTIVAGPNFEPQTTQVGDVRITHWGLPSGRFSWNDTLSVTRDAFSLYETRFGPYPYTELDVAAVPLRTIMGMEYPGLSLIDAGLYSGAQRPFLPIMTAHEIAHQWWYGVVGNDPITAPWQDEGLTEFSALMYFQEYQPAQYAALLSTYESNVAGYESVMGDEPLAQSTAAFVGRRLHYETISYYKGLLFFKELYDDLGAATFYDALQSYYRQHRYAIASPDALLSAFEKSCGCDLSATYAEWGVRQTQ